MMDELYHQGIKGQKWGVRRYQNSDRTWTEEGKLRYGRPNTFKRRKAEYDERHKKKYGSAGPAWFVLAPGGGAISSFIDSRQAKKNENDPHAKKGNKSELFVNTAMAVLAPGGGTAYAAMRAGQSAYSKHMTKKYDAERDANPIDKKTGFHVKQEYMDEAEDAKRVNPEYLNFNSNTKSNCMLCTSAYELRRRGYDVRAEKAGIGYQDTDLERWFPNVKIEHMNVEANLLTNNLSKANARKVVSQIENSQPDGARGNIMVYFGVGGHSMAYEIKNGKMEIVDAQSGKVYKDPESILMTCSGVDVARLDHLKFDPKYIKECCS
ncbi:toxin glutamine deamidase domain-containing protein [Pseudobutyrivibrio sp.]